MNRYVARTWTGIAAAGLLASTAHAAETEQVLLGELLIEGINQNNYTDGDDDRNDRSSQLWIRAKLGAKVDFDDFAEVELALVYDGEGGDASGSDSNETGEVRVNDAFLTLKRLFRDDLHVRLGRQPVAYNLRPNHGAFLHDSRANDPIVTSWDGVRAYWQNVRWTVSGFWFLLDEANESQGLEPSPPGAPGNSRDDTLWGLVVDYQPDADADNRLFFTGSATWEQNSPGQLVGPVGDDLITYHFGFEATLGRGFDLYGEAGFQDGETRDGQDFTGFGFTAGVDYRIPGPMDSILGLQYDFLTGDDPDTDDEFEGFNAPWEGVSDTLIVEHERYGELSELLVGNLQALKLKVEYRFLQDRFRVKMLGAHYRLNEDVGGEGTFGTEVDFTINWQYTYWVNLGLMAGAFIPDDGYVEAVNRALGVDAQDDEIYFLGANAQVVF
jgi:hypothetical protein